VSVNLSFPSSEFSDYLGIKGRTDSALQPRGFQSIEQPKNLVQEIDPETGEIITYQITNKGKKVYKTSQQNRAERYALKSVVNRIFPTSETAKCCRAVIPYQKVNILKDSVHNKAHYAGLRRCSSVWWCPVCAAKISERRRGELVAAVAASRAMLWQVFLMTFTIPHGIGDDLNDILNNMMKAWRKVTTSREGQRIKSIFSLTGTIRALEVTDGDNGFHPHFHVLVFSQSTFSAQTLQSAYLPLWQDACVKTGLPRPSEKHGLRVDDGSMANNYVAKWGLEDEMTKGHTKVSKSKNGMTPWDLLRDVLKNDSDRSRSRFYIYAMAFKGRRQLYWSNGLKALLGITEITDEELVFMQEEHSSVLAELTDEDWKAVLWSRSEAALLDIAETYPSDIPIYLKAIKQHFTRFKRRLHKYEKIK
jgi:plasmid rolling circle replication initiator protein Rep